MNAQEHYMRRCLQLAAEGAGKVSPNPMVGAVLVHGDRIIGEGYHRVYGGPHAEVNCLESVKPEDHGLIAESVLYVSLEPCAHFGKTPPCTGLILKHKIPEVVIGTRDPFPEVNGKGIEKLKAAGVKVTAGVLQEECRLQNKRFFVFHTQQRPYIILKWASSFNGKIAGPDGARVLISNEYTNHVVHKWRSHEDAVMVGSRTAAMDDPLLTTRFWKGRNPVRIVVGSALRLPSGIKLLDGTEKTIVFNTEKEAEEGKVLFYRVSQAEPVIGQVMRALHRLNIQSVLVEGGRALLQSFIAEHAWDEARLITNTGMIIEEGISAPVLQGALLEKKETYLNDTIHYFVSRQQ